MAAAFQRYQEIKDQAGKAMPGLHVGHVEAQSTQQLSAASRASNSLYDAGRAEVKSAQETKPQASLTLPFDKVTASEEKVRHDREDKLYNVILRTLSCYVDDTRRLQELQRQQDLKIADQDDRLHRCVEDLQYISDKQSQQIQKSDDRLRELKDCQESIRKLAETLQRSVQECQETFAAQLGQHRIEQNEALRVALAEPQKQQQRSEQECQARFAAQLAQQRIDSNAKQEALRVTVSQLQSQQHRSEEVLASHTQTCRAQLQEVWEKIRKADDLEAHQVKLVQQAWEAAADCKRSIEEQSSRFLIVEQELAKLRGACQRNEDATQEHIRSTSCATEKLQQELLEVLRSSTGALRCELSRELEVTVAPLRETTSSLENACRENQAKVTQYLREFQDLRGSERRITADLKALMDQQGADLRRSLEGTQANLRDLGAELESLGSLHKKCQVLEGQLQEHCDNLEMLRTGWGVTSSTLEDMKGQLRKLDPAVAQTKQKLSHCQSLVEEVRSIVRAIPTLTTRIDKLESALPSTSSVQKQEQAVRPSLDNSRAGTERRVSHETSKVPGNEVRADPASGIRHIAAEKEATIRLAPSSPSAPAAVATAEQVRADPASSIRHIAAEKEATIRLAPSSPSAPAAVATAEQVRTDPLSGFRHVVAEKEASSRFASSSLSAAAAAATAEQAYPASQAPSILEQAVASSKQMQPLCAAAELLVNKPIPRGIDEECAPKAPTIEPAPKLSSPPKEGASTSSTGQYISPPSLGRPTVGNTSYAHTFPGGSRFASILPQDPVVRGLCIGAEEDMFKWLASGDTPAEIKRKLRITWHPDKSSHPQDIAKEVFVFVQHPAVLTVIAQTYDLLMGQVAP